jgi:[CysO sulfur-carrier protein]-S-L-cysteine hydrolase
LPDAIRAEIVVHARAEEPKEACGLISGRGGVGDRIFRCTNVHPEPNTRYLMDGQEQFDALKAMGGEDNLLAIYHSHPLTEPRPSTTDVAGALWPDQFYVVVSLRSTEPEIGAFRILKGEVFDVELA